MMQNYGYIIVKAVRGFYRFGKKKSKSNFNKVHYYFIYDVHRNMMLSDDSHSLGKVFTSFNQARKWLDKMLIAKEL